MRVLTVSTRGEALWPPCSGLHSPYSTDLGLYPADPVHRPQTRPLPLGPNARSWFSDPFCSVALADVLSPLRLCPPPLFVGPSHPSDLPENGIILSCLFQGLHGGSLRVLIPLFISCSRLPSVTHNRHYCWPLTSHFTFKILPWRPIARAGQPKASHQGWPLPTATTRWPEHPSTPPPLIPAHFKLSVPSPLPNMSCTLLPSHFRSQQPHAGQASLFHFFLLGKSSFPKPAQC